jgi:gluconolactonase
MGNLPREISMRRLSTSSILTACWVLMTPAMQAQAEDLSTLLAPGASLERVATGLKFAEGPVWDGQRLLVSDILGDTVYALAEDGRLLPVQTPSRWANGHTWDRTAALLQAEHASGAVTRHTTDGQVETVADRFEGKRLNSPNDVVVRSDGSIYITDPPFGLKPPYGPTVRQSELDFAGVYRIDPKTKAVTLITKNLIYPNGITFSPDERRLYLNDTATQKIWAYDMAPDGRITGHWELADLTVKDAKGVVDGMKVDALGHVYSICPAGVCILSSEGKLLGTISVPEQATDVAWGGPKHNVLYVTASTSIYRIQTQMVGVGSGLK